MMSSIVRREKKMKKTESAGSDRDYIITTRLWFVTTIKCSSRKAAHSS